MKDSVVPPLQNVDSDVLTTVEKEIMILLHPKFMNDFKKGVFEELEFMLNKYSFDLGGIVMNYEKVKIPSHYGISKAENPFLHFPVQAKFKIFSPKIGDTVEACVVKKSANHVGSLVYGLYNLSSVIPKSNYNNWLGSKVHEKQNIKVKITYIDKKSASPFFRGDIESLCNASKHTKFEDKDETESEIKTSEIEPQLQTIETESELKTKEIEPKLNNIETEPKIKTEILSPKRKKEKKSKRRKFKEEENEQTEEVREKNPLAVQIKAEKDSQLSIKSPKKSKKSSKRKRSVSDDEVTSHKKIKHEI